MSFSEQDFDKIKWGGYRVKPRKTYLTKLIAGFDSEAYSSGVYLDSDHNSGRPFMFTLVIPEEGYAKVFRAREINDLLDELLELRVDIFVWNLTYEIGAILRALTISKDDLWQIWQSKGEKWIQLEGHRWEIKVIAGKCLRIRDKWKRRAGSIVFWDANNFFQTSLERAAEKFLGEEKIGIDPLLFTPKYVREHWEEIKEYCLRDASLVVQLMERAIDLLQGQFGFTPKNYYSVASWASEYFRQWEPENMSYFWRYRREIVKWSWYAYRGGKFDMRIKGYVPYAVLYDIISAYAYELSRLKSLYKAKIVKTSFYCPEADYALIHCIIEVPIDKDVPHPISVKVGGLSLFPVGMWEAYITKTEYEYLMQRSISVDILEAYWFYCQDRYLYKEGVEKLFEMKESADEVGDVWVRELAKGLMNSFYGKLVQCIVLTDKTIKPGIHWHPLHGGIITANVRVRLCELEATHEVLAVHTDSIILTKPIPELEVRKLGGWVKKHEGEYIGIRTGIYQVGKKVAHRGFMGQTEDWFSILRAEYPDATKIISPGQHLSTWVEAARAQDPNLINKMVMESKEIDLNYDMKRHIERKKTVEDFLSGPIQTLPQLVWMGHIWQRKQEEAE